jgi:hypothetical protein
MKDKDSKKREELIEEELVQMSILATLKSGDDR